MLTQTQIINAVKNIVGFRAYEEKVRFYEGDLYLHDAVKWAAMVAFRNEMTGNSECDILRQALDIYDQDRLANFQNLPK